MRARSMHSARLALRDKRAFTALLRAEFGLRWHGFHGAAHWARVARNGAILCARTPAANPRVVALFALLHDLRREDEGGDPGHGPRAAAFVRTIACEHLRLGAQELAQLAEACDGHSDGRLHDDPTIAACWDADRLDLGRVGKRPHPARLSLEAARDPALMEWAYRQSRAWR